MGEYIKREEAIAYPLSWDHYDKAHGNRHFIAGVESYREYIEELQTADVVDVVRCKDCKHRIYDGSRDLYYCEMYHGMGDVSDDNYCSFGEKADTLDD